MVGVAQRVLVVLVVLLVPVVGHAPPAAVADPSGAPRATAPVVPGAGTFRPPLTGGLRVVTPYDPPERPWHRGHRGVDLATPPHAQVVVPAAGTVVHAGSLAGRPVVSVEHAGGLRTTYEPVYATVSRGQEVATGTVLGRVAAGHPGCPVEACLHWGARPGGDPDTYVDPMTLLAVDHRPIRLKPLRPGDGSV